MQINEPFRNNLTAVECRPEAVACLTGFISIVSLPQAISRPIFFNPGRVESTRT